MSFAKMILIIFPFVFLGCTQVEQTQNNSSVTLNAVSDFIVSETIGLYIDDDRQAIAIEAANVAFRNQLLSSTHKVNWLGEPEIFNVKFEYISEKDGEPKYEFWVNDQFLETTMAKETNEEFENNFTQWEAIKLAPGDIITVKSNAVTNGKILEGDGTAYARGRWVSLTFTKNN